MGAGGAGAEVSLCRRLHAGGGGGRAGSLSLARSTDDDGRGAVAGGRLFRTWLAGAGKRLAIDEPYFGMYVSIQKYAAEKLRTGGAVPAGASGSEAEDTGFQRHGRYFAQFGTEEALDALDAHGGLARHQALSIELENLITACRRAVCRGDAPTAVATCAAAWGVLELKGLFLLAAKLAKPVLELAAL